ncbi:MAG: hypothetical protein SVZ03_05875 [Spirochaetota bacterium]|nr:hypothetical protein [Spirochaetota bacterium]
MIFLKNITGRSYFFCALIILIVFINITIYPEFLLDEEEVDKTEEIKPEKQDTPEKSLPKGIVTGIYAESIPDIKGAIRITWKMPEDSEDDFIVGRTTEQADTANKALGSMSVKVVPSGSPPSVIDSNLPPGIYYYCILAKKSIINKTITLYPNMNYTTTPVVIEKETPRILSKNPPMQVTLIHTRRISQRWVLITWRGIEARGIIYTVYRGNSVLDTTEKLRRAEKIISITDDREGFIDKNLKKSGTYYYAVTTRDFEGNEDLQLISDQSYTTTGVYISIGIHKTVSNIQARLTDKGSIKINWSGETSGISQFLIYKYYKPISDAQRLSLATFLERVDVGATSYVDHYPGFGNHYYAVLNKLGDGTIDTKLIKGKNYTTDPISIGKPIQIQFITSETRDKSVIINWKFNGSAGNRNYRIVRNNNEIMTLADVDDSFTLDIINVFDQNYIDESPPSGSHYYALVPEDLKRYSDYRLLKGVNVTEYPVVIQKKMERPKEEIAIDDKKNGIKERYQIRKPIRKGLKQKVKPSGQQVDSIVQDFFFKGKYNVAIKELQNIINYTDNEYEAAKAKLFIGRSWLELKRYRKALKMLLLPDVKKHFPQESKFWSEHAISRVY